MKKTYFYGGRFFKDDFNWNTLPIGVRIEMTNPSDVFTDRGYVWVRFEKISATKWKVVQVWFVREKDGYEDVENGAEFNLQDIIRMNNGNKQYEVAARLSFPLYKENGDMNILESFGDDLSGYGDYSAIQLFKEVADYNKQVYIKFSHRDNNILLINVIKGKRTFFVRCPENEFDEFCHKHGIGKIARHSFNTYW